MTDSFHSSFSALLRLLVIASLSIYSIPVHALRDFYNETYYESWHTCDERWPSTCCPSQCTREAIMSSTEGWSRCEDSLPPPCEMHIYVQFMRHSMPCKLTEADVHFSDAFDVYYGRSGFLDETLTPVIFEIPEWIARNPIPEPEILMELRNPPWSITKTGSRGCELTGPWQASISQWIADWDWSYWSSSICHWVQPQIQIHWKHISMEEHVQTTDHMHFNLTRIMRDDVWQLPFNRTLAFWLWPRDDCYVTDTLVTYTDRNPHSWPVQDWKFIKHGRGKNLTADPSFQEWQQRRRRLAENGNRDLSLWVRPPRGRFAMNGCETITSIAVAVGTVAVAIMAARKL